MGVGSLPDLGMVLLQYVCLLFSLCFHEAAHATMSNYRGDPSARLMGRMSLNPLVHIDPIGTVVLPLVMMISSIPFLIGWAKPVPFNPRNLKDIRRDPVWIALAGPFSNLILAVFFLIVLRVLIMALGIDTATAVEGTPWCLVPLYMVLINVALMLFNLIPVPPLDGHHLLYAILPPGGQRAMEQIGPFGILIVIFLARPVLSHVMPVVLGFLFSITFWGM